MAETITIQKLIDASMDSDSLEVLVNGNENTAVITRTGETYPSAKKALKQMFENGGLPATPFATKALMTASALVDGKYAQVTDDTVAANNGLYLKTADAWIKSKYDPVTIAKNHTIGEMSTLRQEVSANLITQKESLSDFKKTKVGFDLVDASYLTPTGSVVPSNDWKTSTKIAVKKGDCYILRDDGISATIDTTIINVFSFYSAAGVFEGALHSSRCSTSDIADSQLVNELHIGDFFDLKDYFSYSAIIPEDGFITVTTSNTLLSYGNFGSNKTKPVLFKVGFDEYINNTVKYCQKPSLSSFNGLVHSVLSDKNIPNNGKLSYTLKKVNASEGAEYFYEKTIGVGNSIISKPYLISKGEYIHYSLYQNPGDMRLVFEDAAGVYLGTQNIVTEYTTGGDKSGAAAFNIKSEYDGFFRLIYLNQKNSTPLVGVTKNPINYKRMDVESNLNNIRFYSCLGKIGRTADDTHVSNSYVNSFNFNNAGNKTIANTISRPYFLPKGKVLRHQLSCTASPLMLVVIKADYQLSGKELQSRALYNVRYLPVIATSVYTQEHRLAWVNRNPLTNTKQYLHRGEAGKVDYCNEDDDTLVVFLKPTKDFNQFDELKLNENYKVSVFDKEVYKAIRKKELENHFKTVTGYGLSGLVENISLTGGVAAHKGLGTYPPVILFKGEVLNYATNFHAKSDARNLNTELGIKLKGEVYIDLSFSYGWTGSSSVNFIPLWDRDISLDDKLSYRYNQILALETCTVYPGVSVKGTDGIKDVDVNGLIKNQYFKPRIVDLKDVVVGENVKPLFSPLFTQNISYTKDPVTGEILTSSLGTNVSGSVDYITSFAPKGAYVEYSMWSHYTTINLWKNNTLGNKTSRPYPINQWSPELYFDEYKNWKQLGGQPSLVTNASQVNEDSILLLNSKTAERSLVESIVNYNSSDIKKVIDTINYPKQMEKYRHEIKTIEACQYNNEYQVTDKTFLNITIGAGIVFDLRTMSSVSLEEALWGVLQIRQGDDVLAVLNVKTENQGQSSADYARKNVNLEFYNDKYQEVFIKFDDYIAQEEVVLKSYERSDRGNWRESTANRLWYKVRNSKPYPYGGVFPFYIYSDPKKPTNQSARGTTYSLPVEFHRGGEFWGLFSIRNKKKRDNYCAEKKNKDHILIQADRTLMQFSWSSLELGMFEVRNPSISGYTEGDKVLPIGNEGIEANTSRILSWLKGCYNGDVDMAATYHNYINLDSFIDYCITMQYVYNWDGNRNNFLLGSFDGKIWYVYQYDADHTFGGYSEVYSAPFSPFKFDADARGSLFTKMLTIFPDKIQKKYFELRGKGIFDVKNIQGMINDCNDKINAYARKKDLEYWGDFLPAQDVGFGMWWTAQRMNFLDAFYGYNEYGEKLVVNTLFSPATIQANSIEAFNFKVSGIDANDKLSYNIGADTHSLVIDVVFVSSTSINLVITNNSSAAIKVDGSYLQIFKE